VQDRKTGHHPDENLERKSGSVRSSSAPEEKRKKN